MPGAHLLRRSRGAAPGLEIDVEARLLIRAHLLRIEIGRVIAARDPVQREGDLLRGAGDAPSATAARAAENDFRDKFMRAPEIVAVS